MYSISSGGTVYRWATTLNIVLLLSCSARKSKGKRAAYSSTCQDTSQQPSGTVACTLTLQPLLCLYRVTFGWGPLACFSLSYLGQVGALSAMPYCARSSSVKSRSKCLQTD